MLIKKIQNENQKFIQMKLKTISLFILFTIASISNINAQTTPNYWKFAPTPPLGWNSWDIYGTTFT
jgi:hypothetical protein